MILTKRQIINIEHPPHRFKGKVPDKFIKKMMGEPEVDFIKSAKKQLNWNLEPIRRNQYIVT